MTAGRLAGFLAMLGLVACANTGGPPGAGRPQASAGALSGPIAKATVYQPVDWVSAMPFIVLEVTALDDDGFDYYLRDRLAEAGFPRGIMHSQLPRLYVDAGLAESTPDTNDPMALRRLSDVLGPFVRLKVDYDYAAYGIDYRVELWDVRSATPVLALDGYKLIWWSVSKELGPEIVAALVRWREDSLVKEKAAAENMPRSQT